MLLMLPAERAGHQGAEVAQEHEGAEEPRQEAARRQEVRHHRQEVGASCGHLPDGGVRLGGCKADGGRALGGQPAGAAVRQHSLSSTLSTLDCCVYTHLADVKSCCAMLHRFFAIGARQSASSLCHTATFLQHPPRCLQAQHSVPYHLRATELRQMPHHIPNAAALHAQRPRVLGPHISFATCVSKLLLCP